MPIIETEFGILCINPNIFCNEGLSSWMMEIWMTKYLVGDNNNSIVNQ